jgi:hypothetical protein
MKKKHAAAGPEQELASAVRSLEHTIVRMPEEHGIVFHPAKHLLFTYMKGIAYGLGALTAVALILPLILSLLQQVAWVPIAGDFVHRVIERLEQSQGR